MSQGADFRKLVTQGLPIALIILYVLFPGSFNIISSQPLGKCIAIGMIVFYTFQDMMFGFIVCLLIILFYQRDSTTERFLSKQTQKYVDFLPKPSLKEGGTNFENHIEKDFTPVEDAYPVKLAPIRKVSEHLFRKEFCHSPDNGLTYKDQKVKNSLVSYVYPQLSFRNGECNPCDKTCHFTIKKKNDAEEDLQPKSSKFSSIRDMANYVLLSEEEPIVVFQSHVATKVAAY